MRRALLFLVTVAAVVALTPRSHRAQGTIGNYTANKIIGGTKPTTCNAGPPADVWADTTVNPPVLNVCGPSGFVAVAGSVPSPLTITSATTPTLSLISSNATGDTVLISGDPRTNVGGAAVGSIDWSFALGGFHFILPRDVGTHGYHFRNHANNTDLFYIDSISGVTSNSVVSAPSYQTSTVPAYVFVTSDFTTSGSGTALEAITGLTWTFPANTALNISFHCAMEWHQNAAPVAVAFGFQDATVAPTNLAAQGTMTLAPTTATASPTGNLVASATTTATNIVSGTPSAITTNWTVVLDGFVEQPSNASSSVFTIRTSTASQADTVTVPRGGYCKIG